jgi:hypothetical protein
MNECDHIYRLLQTQCTIEAWKKCGALLEKFYKKRECAELTVRSTEFEKRIEMEITRFPGYLTPKTRSEVIEYIRLLEWKLQQLNIAEK